MPPPSTSLTSTGTSFILGAPSIPPMNLHPVYQSLVNACGGQMLLNASQSCTTRFTVSHSKCLTYATVLFEHGVACFPPGFWREKQPATTNATPALALAPPPSIFGKHSTHTSHARYPAHPERHTRNSLVCHSDKPVQIHEKQPRMSLGTDTRETASYVTPTSRYNIDLYNKKVVF